VWQRELVPSDEEIIKKVFFSIDQETYIEKVFGKPAHVEPVSDGDDSCYENEQALKPPSSRNAERGRPKNNAESSQASVVV
jgi:hypothetical protein